MKGVTLLVGTADVVPTDTVPTLLLVELAGYVGGGTTEWVELGAVDTGPGAPLKLVAFWVGVECTIVALKPWNELVAAAALVAETVTMS